MKTQILYVNIKFDQTLTNALMDFCTCFIMYDSLIMSLKFLYKCVKVKKDHDLWSSYR